MPLRTFWATVAAQMRRASCSAVCSFAKSSRVRCFSADRACSGTCFAVFVLRETGGALFLGMLRTTHAAKRPQHPVRRAGAAPRACRSIKGLLTG
jgi:hypothetical protein